MQDKTAGQGNAGAPKRDAGKVEKSVDEWREELSDEQFRVCRLCGTEPPFTGKFWSTKTRGLYRCTCCRAPLFRSEAKFDSGSGWPSYWQPVSAEAVRELPDYSHGMIRVEIRCARCDSHLGHVFEDGPPPTGLRYCVNSASLTLEPDPEQG